MYTLDGDIELYVQTYQVRSNACGICFIVKRHHIGIMCSFSNRHNQLKLRETNEETAKV